MVIFLALPSVSIIFTTQIALLSGKFCIIKKTKTGKILIFGTIHTIASSRYSYQYSAWNMKPCKMIDIVKLSFVSHPQLRAIKEALPEKIPSENFKLQGFLKKAYERIASYSAKNGGIELLYDVQVCNMHAHNLKKWFAGSIMVHYGTKIEQRNLSLVGRCRVCQMAIGQCSWLPSHWHWCSVQVRIFLEKMCKKTTMEHF